MKRISTNSKSLQGKLSQNTNSKIAKAISHNTKTPLLFLMISVIALSIFSVSCFAGQIKIDVSIKESISFFSTMNNDVFGNTVSSSVIIENMGSLGCNAMPRIEFYNISKPLQGSQNTNSKVANATLYDINKTSDEVSYNNSKNPGDLVNFPSENSNNTNVSGELVYTAWGSEIGQWPGASDTWYIYSYLKPGEYEARLKIMFCNDIYESKTANITVNESLTKTDDKALFIESAVAADNKIVVKINAPDYKGSVVVLPLSYPSKWIVVANKINLTNTSIAELEFKPTIWRESDIKFAVVTDDGKYNERTIFVKKEENNTLQILALIALFAVCIIISFLIRGVFNKNKQAGKKKK